jgi:hypothetical protein
MKSPSRQLIAGTGIYLPLFLPFRCKITVGRFTLLRAIMPGNDEIWAVVGRGVGKMNNSNPSCSAKKKTHPSGWVFLFDEEGRI